MYNSVTSSRILARDTRISNDTWKTGLNNNDILVGPSGAGKTRGYVIPNILHAQDSLIVADTKGNLCRNYGEYLRQQGYTVMHLDFTDTARSPWGYNPLSFIRKNRESDVLSTMDRYSKQDVQKLAEAICPCQNSVEPFWDSAAEMYLEAILLYILNMLPEEQHNLYEAYSFLTKMGSKALDAMLQTDIHTYPRSSFARKFQMISQNRQAEKMDASIKGILAHHLNSMAWPGIRSFFTAERQIDMNAFLEGKTALFLSVSDSDRSQDKLVNLFYTQALQFLMSAADRQPDSRLPIPVRFILDDFSTNTVIPNFDNIISVIRSREIYVSLIVQSLSQLTSLYGEDRAQTILNNCDHCVYLGGTDLRTAQYFSVKLNRQVSTVLDLPLNSMFLFERGSKARELEKYDLEQDEIYLNLNSFPAPRPAARCGGPEL